MKTATLWRRPEPLNSAEGERDYSKQFQPEPLAPVADCSADVPFPKRGSSAPQRKPRKPKLTLLPDPVPEPARGSATDPAAGAIQLYLREVGQVKLLTPQQETELVARTRQGDRKARETLIKGHLRRVVEISSEYENIGLSLLDLISEGNLGLMKAVDRFDPAKGAAFSAFSTWWIKQAIKRALAHSPQCHAS
jgi:DNA-directed RNA polymerase sigma subunit (sigma70/sigma32)